MKNMFCTAKRKTGVENTLADSGCSQWHKIVELENYPTANTHIQDGQGKLTQAPWHYEEGGQHGATVSLLTACASIQPALRRLDGNSGQTVARPEKNRRRRHPRIPSSLVASHRGPLQ